MHRKKVTVISLIILGFLVFGLVGWNTTKQLLIQHFFANMPKPTPTISTVTAEKRPWTQYIESVGTLHAVNGVQVSAQSSGHVTQILAKPGQLLKAGQPIIQLDNDLERALVKKHLAILALAQLNHDRRLKLSKTTVSPAEIDESKARLDEAKANLAYYQAQLSRKQITAPFQGLAGLIHVDIGDYITAGTPLVSLQSTDPLEVHFHVSEHEAPKVYSGQKVSVRLPQDTQAHMAKIVAIDSQIDNTQSLSIKARLMHSHKTLMPGFFVHVRSYLPDPKPIIVLPQTAVVFNPYGDAVYVVDQDNKAHLRYVVLGERRADQVTVKEGLKPGEQVVSSGQLKLRDGIHVLINNEPPQKAHAIH